MDDHGQSWVGRTLGGRYRVEEALQRGGMGAVYRARDRNMRDRPVVVKHPLRGTGPVGEQVGRDLRRRFADEVGRLIDLSDVPGVVRITDQGVEDGIPYYVMDHMAGGSLAQRLAGEPASPGEVQRWATEVAGTLDEIHARGLIHRDVKPANLLFPRAGGEGRAHVADFGIVKELEAEWATTGALNTVIGTPGFMAPEQALPDVVVDGRADQFALAATMYVALAGRPPVYETTGGPGGTRKRLKPVNALDVAPHVPAAAAHAIAKGLAREPEDRFRTCAALAEAFGAGLVASPTGPATARASPAPRSPRQEEAAAAPAPAPRRGWKPLLYLASAAVLAVGGLVAAKALGLPSSPSGAGSTTAPKPAEAAAVPSVPPGAKAPEPSAPQRPAWEEPLAAAEAAMAKDDGEAARAALTLAVDAGAPAARARDLQRYVDAWTADPVLALLAPAEGAVIEAGPDGAWTIDVQGSLVSGRKTDAVWVDESRVRTGPGPYATRLVRREAGSVQFRVEVRDGDTLRRTSRWTVTLVASRPGPPGPGDPAWAVTLLSKAQREEAQRLGVAAAFEEPTTRMRFVLIPGGTFTMGSPAAGAGGEGSDELPAHRVAVRPFYLAIHEVTNGQYRTFEASHKSRAHLDGDTQPVVEVTHGEAEAFVGWLSQQGSGTTKGGYRLPSEAEWEYACRAGTTTRFAFGDADLTKDQANFSGGAGKTLPVGTYPANRLALFDMHGNVWEWCADDWHDSYAGAPGDGRAWVDAPRAAARVNRGGGWFDVLPYLVSSNRGWNEPSARFDVLGFRAARTLAASGEAPPPAPPSSPSPTAGTTPPPPEPAVPSVPSWAQALVAKEQVEEARRLGVAVAFENAIGMRFVLIPGGTFTMGSPPSEKHRAADEVPHRVTVSPYYLGVTEVTNAQYKRGTVPPQPGTWEYGTLDADEQPAVWVTHNDAETFAVWLSRQRDGRTYRLPTEAEWERAARSGTDRRFPWGDAGHASTYANWCTECAPPLPPGAQDDPGAYVPDGFQNVTGPVGSYPATPWGLYDMAGNAAEWVHDWYGDYPGASQKDPQGPSRSEAKPVDLGPFGSSPELRPGRVTRGSSHQGGWIETRCAARGKSDPFRRSERVGFRIAAEVVPAR